MDPLGPFRVLLVCLPLSLSLSLPFSAQVTSWLRWLDSVTCGRMEQLTRLYTTFDRSWCRLSCHWLVWQNTLDFSSSDVDSFGFFDPPRGFIWMTDIHGEKTWPFCLFRDFWWTTLESILTWPKHANSQAGKEAQAKMKEFGATATSPTRAGDENKDFVSE